MSQGIDFRVFVSSTFGDMLAERSALQNEVFPRVQAFCRARGASFRAIDLRWGISAEAARARRTMDTCLTEVRRCYRVSPTLDFIALIGSRYGWRPLPDWIIGPDFDALVKAAVAPDRRLLLRAYRRDDNALPARWVLRPQSARAPAASVLEAEQALRDALDRALGHAWPANDRRQVRYGASATHLEIAERLALDSGLSPAPGTGPLCYLREPRRAAEIAQGDRSGLAVLKGELLAHLSEHGLHRYRLASDGSGLSAWCERIERDLIARVKRRLRSVAGAPKTDALQAQAAYADGLAHGALGQHKLLARVRLHVETGEDLLVITGISGSGKSTLLARIWRGAPGRRAGEGPLVLARFIGSTPESRDLETLLRSLCAEIDTASGLEKTLPAGADALAKALVERLSSVSAERPLVILIDALDQLDARNAMVRLAWLPPQIPPNVRMVISVLDDPGAAGDTLRALRARLPRQAFLAMPRLPQNDARALLASWLTASGRSLQEAQTKSLLSAASRCRTPLFLRLATIEAMGWRSFDRPGALPADTEALLAKRFAQLSHPSWHGAAIVRGVLALLGAARNGLNEEELLALLVNDAEVMAELAQRSPHWPLDGTLPFVVWARLHADLAPYLAERAADGTEVMAFFHGAVQRAVEKTAVTKGRALQAHTELARFFGGGFATVPQPHRFAALRHEPPRPNRRKLSELAYQQTLAGAWTELFATLGDLLFVRAKCGAGLTSDLVADYERAVDAIESVGQSGHAERFRELLDWQSFVVRERAAFEAHAAVEGFVLQQALNAGGAFERAWQALPRRERSHPGLRIEQRSASAMPLATLEGHMKGVTDCVFDANGRWLFTSGMDGKVLAWRSRSWGLEDLVAELPGSADSVAATADGRRVASVCADGHVRIHDRQTRATLVCEGRFELAPRRCRFVNGDRELLSVGYRGLQLHDAATGTLLRRALDEAIINDCTAGPGNLVTLGDCEGRVLVFDLKAWELREHFYLDDVTRVQGSALSADGSRLLATGGRFTAEDDMKPFGSSAIWRLSGGARSEDREELELDRHKTPALNCIFIDEERAFVVGLQDGTLAVHRSNNGESIRRIRAHTNGLRGLALSPDGGWLASAAFDGRVRVWSVATLLTEEKDVGESRHGLFCAVASNALDGWALTATQDQHLAQAWWQQFGREPSLRRLARSRRLDELPLVRRDPAMPRQVFEVGFEGVGARAAHRGSPLSCDGIYALVHASARLSSPEFHLLPMLAETRWSSDNLTWALSIDGRETALVRGALARGEQALERRLSLLWFADDRSTKPDRRFEFTTPLSEAVGPCQFSLSPHVVLLAVGSQVLEFGIDGASRVVARSDAPVRVYVESYLEPLHKKVLLVGATDGSVSLWNLDEASEVHRTPAHRGEVVDLAFVDDERFISAGIDGTLRLWRVRDGGCDAVFVAEAALAAVDTAMSGRRVMALDTQGQAYWLHVMR